MLRVAIIASQENQLLLDYFLVYMPFMNLTTPAFGTPLGPL